MSDPFENEKVKRAITEETEKRDAAFIALSDTIAGLELKPLNLRHYLRLSLAGNAFVTGAAPMAEDAAVFLYVVSESTEAKRAFARRIAGYDFATVCRGILAFMDEALFDAPLSTVKGHRRSYYSIAASLTDVFASEYGWTLAEIMATPLAALFQLLRVIQKRHNSDIPLLNPLSDRALLEAVAS